MKKGVKYLIISLVVIGIVGGIYFIGFGSDKSVDTFAASNMLTAQVFKGDIEVTTSGSSVIESADKKNITSINSGTVESIFVEAGQVVNEGDLLVTFENDSTSSEIERLKLELQQEVTNLSEINEDTENLYVYAPISGYVGEISIDVGDEVNNGSKLTTITDNEHINIIGYYNKGEYNNIKIGDKANVTMDKYMTIVEGTVVRINQTPQTRDNGVVLYEVIVEVVNPGAVAEGEAGRVSIKSNGAEFRSYEDSTFSYSNTSDIIIKSGGEITSININNGDYVEKGELLIVLDGSDIDRQINDQQNKVDMKNSELSEKLKTLDDTAIYAPISGTVTAVNITVGEKVGSNTSLLSISDLNNLEITIPVDELDINKIQLGQEAQVTAEAISGKIFNAVVSKIGLEGESQNGVSTFDVTLQINDSEALRPGMTGEGKIIIEQKKDILLLPIEAIQTRKNESFVLLTGEAQSSESDMITVKTGLVSDSFVEIVEGLNDGAEVVYQSTAIKSETQAAPGMMRVPGMPAGSGKSGGGER